MTSTVDPPVPEPARSPSVVPPRPSDATPTRPPARPPASPWRPLLRRVHFYAGVLVAPFIAVAALSGLLFVFTPQLDAVLHHRELYADTGGRPPVSLDRQVAAARAAVPGLPVVEVVPAPEGRTTRVVLADPALAGEDKQRTVFVHPATAEVRGTLVTWWGATPSATWSDRLHKDLHLGEPGRLYTELAASWAGVIALVGVVLWAQHLRAGRRGASRRPEGTARRWLVPDLRTRGARRTLTWHGVTGTWIVLGLLALAVTGLTWSAHAGDRFTSLLDAAHGHRPQVDAVLDVPVAVTEPLTYDQVERAAAQAGLRRPWLITPPPDGRSGWVVAENDWSWRVQADVVTLDPVTATVNARVDHADWPFLAQLSQWGIKAHMGQAFGLLNQLLLAALAIGLLAVVVWGYRRWWQRRPAGTRWRPGSAPPRGGWRRVPPGQLAAAGVVVLALGWAMPVFGLSLLGFLLVDLAVGAVRRVRAPA